MNLMDRLGGRWVEVDLDAITHNYRECLKLVNPSTRIMAIVKADACGCGAVETARAFIAAGVGYLGVTTVDEGVELRQAGISVPILVMGPLLPSQAETVVEHSLTQALSSREMAEALGAAARKRGRRVRVHIKIETGMGRSGFLPQEAVEQVPGLKDCPELELEGIFTHFSTATAADKTFTRQQLDRLLGTIGRLEAKGISFPLRHAANSAATLDLPAAHLDMVRLGTVLYGQYPSPHVSRSLELRDPWRLRARVVHLKELPAGSGVGYGKLFVTRRPTRVAVLPVGYVDGYTLEPILRPTGWWDLIKVLGKTVLLYLGYGIGPAAISFEGETARAIGKVAMQFTMVDVSHLPRLQVGDIGTMPARRTVVSPRLPKLYLKDRAPYKVVTPWEGEPAGEGREALGG